MKVTENKNISSRKAVNRQNVEQTLNSEYRIDTLDQFSYPQVNSDPILGLLNMNEEDKEQREGIEQ